MIPAAFEYARASSVEEASKLLNKYGDDAKVLAGGHSLIPLMRLRLAQPKALVDINGIKDLDHIKESGSKLHVGALARHVTIQNSAVVKEKLPILAEVAGEVGRQPGPQHGHDRRRYGARRRGGRLPDYRADARRRDRHQPADDRRQGLFQRHLHDAPRAG